MVEVAVVGIASIEWCTVQVDMLLRGVHRNRDG